MSEGFKRRRKNIDRKTANSFAEEADVTANSQGDSDKSQKKNSTEEAVEHWGTSLYPIYIEIINALSYYNRCSQREIIEKLIDGEGYSENNIKKSLNAYRDK